MLPAFRQCVIDDTVYDKVDPLLSYAPVKTPGAFIGYHQNIVTS